MASSVGVSRSLREEGAGRGKRKLRRASLRLAALRSGMPSGL